MGRVEEINARIAKKVIEAEEREEKFANDVVEEFWDTVEQVIEQLEDNQLLSLQKISVKYKITEDLIEKLEKVEVTTSNKVSDVLIEKDERIISEDVFKRFVRKINANSNCGIMNLNDELISIEFVYKKPLQIDLF